MMNFFKKYWYLFLIALIGIPVLIGIIDKASLNKLMSNLDKVKEDDLKKRAEKLKNSFSIVKIGEELNEEKSKTDKKTLQEIAEDLKKRH